MVDSNQRKCMFFFFFDLLFIFILKDFNEVLVMKASEYYSVVVTNLNVPIEFVKININ